MKNKFESIKSAGLGTLLIVVSFLILFLSFGLPVILKQQIGSTEFIIKTLVSVLTIGFFIWCWTRTYYEIDSTRLLATCGPIRIQVKILDIKEIVTGQKTIGGIIKPTLSWNCIVIKYGDFNELSISPENQDTFINTLTDLNKEIKIKYCA